MRVKMIMNLDQKTITKFVLQREALAVASRRRTGIKIINKAKHYFTMCALNKIGSLQVISLIDSSASELHAYAIVTNMGYKHNDNLCTFLQKIEVLSEHRKGYGTRILNQVLEQYDNIAAAAVHDKIGFFEKSGFENLGFVHDNNSCIAIFKGDKASPEYTMACNLVLLS
jgi:hypothetical protein